LTAIRDNNGVGGGAGGAIHSESTVNSDLSIINTIISNNNAD